jgi:hypothetical protein
VGWLGAGLCFPIASAERRVLRRGGMGSPPRCLLRVRPNAHRESSRFHTPKTPTRNNSRGETHSIASDLEPNRCASTLPAARSKRHRHKCAATQRPDNQPGGKQRLNSARSIPATVAGAAGFPTTLPASMRREPIPLIKLVRTAAGMMSNGAAMSSQGGHFGDLTGSPARSRPADHGARRKNESR